MVEFELKESSSGLSLATEFKNKLAIEVKKKKRVGFAQDSDNEDVNAAT